jgi:protein O-GlcNAc transferase
LRGAGIGPHRWGRLSEAEACHRGVLAVQSNQQTLSTFWLLLLTERGADASLELIGQAIKLNKENPRYFFDIGNTLLRLTRFDEALDCHVKALALGPRNVAAFNNQGTRVCSSSGSTKRSPVLTGRCPLKPGDAFAFYNRGNVLAELKRFDEALACYGKAPALRPGDAAAFSSRGNACGKREGKE